MKRTIILKWLFVAFIICFMSLIILMFYYANFYLGDSNVLQTAYFNLFYCSLILLFIIIVLKISNWIKKL